MFFVGSTHKLYVQSICDVSWKWVKEKDGGRRIICTMLSNPLLLKSSSCFYSLTSALSLFLRLQFISSASRISCLSHFLPTYFHTWRALGPLLEVRRVETKGDCMLVVLCHSVTRHLLSYAWCFGSLLTLQNLFRNSCTLSATHSSSCLLVFIYINCNRPLVSIGL